MSVIRNYQQVERRCVLRPSGVATPGELAHLIADALTQAREEGLRHALIDIRAVTGFESPGPAFRRWAVGLWARSAADGPPVAIIARPEHICPEKTGLLAAAEEGLHANIFDAEPPALAWLESTSHST